MGAGGGREGYGVVGRRAVSVVDDLAGLVADLDAGLVGGRDALDLVAEFSRAQHVASAGLMAMARRVAQTNLWSRGGHRSPAHWLSHVTGVSVGEAVGLLETAEVVETAPDTRGALVEGKVSPRQARAIGRAERADPDAGRRLLERVEGSSTRETETDANRIVAAALPESAEARAERHRRVRRFRHGVNDDGMGWGAWLLPIAQHTRYIAAVEAEQGVVFERARRSGEREPAEAYAADALCNVLDRALTRPGTAGERAGGRATRAPGATRVSDPSLSGPTLGSPTTQPTPADPSTADPSTALPSTADPSLADPSIAASSLAGRSLQGADAGGNGQGGGGSVVEDWSFAKVIVKVDLTALDRGTVAAGEVCEIAGQGPVPVDDVWRMIDGDAFVAAVSTRGAEIAKVIHLGRRPTALQRTALEFLGDGACQIRGCSSRARLEIDHVADWAATHRTHLDELAQVCGHHHDLKTHQHYRFGPLDPDGQRQLIPPNDTGPPGPTGLPDNTGPPGGTKPPEHPAPGAGTDPRDPARDPVHRTRRLARGTQGDLFDTG